MYTQFQRFVATLLLFSILLQSCGNPNWKIADDASPRVASAKTMYHPAKVKQRSKSSALATVASVTEGPIEPKVGAPPALGEAASSTGSTEALAEVFSKASDALAGEASHSLYGDRSSTPFRSPVADAVSQHPAPSSPSHSSSATSERKQLIEKKPQHVALDQESIARRKAAPVEAARPTQPQAPQSTSYLDTERLHSVFSRQPKAQHTIKATERKASHLKPASSVVLQPYPSAQGHQVRFQEANGKWIAQVQDVWGRAQVLPVVCAPDQSPTQALQKLASKAPGQHKYWVHVLETHQTPWAPRVVYVGALGVRGGGNTCPYAHQVRARDSSSEEDESNNDYEVYVGSYRLYRTTAGNWANDRYWVRSETPVPALSANDVRAVSWYFHDCSAMHDRGDCLYPSADFNHIRRMAERRREERRERRRQKEARRQEEERKRQEEELRIAKEAEDQAKQIYFSRWKIQEELRRAEERKQKLDETHRREEERRRQEEARREQEERRARLDETHRREEERRRQEEARRQKEELKRQEEARRQEEERKRQEEARRQEEERKRQEEARRQEEERKRQEEARRQEEERKRQEEARRQEEERKRQEEARRQEEERKRQEEARRQEEERRRQEEARRQEEERRRQEEARRQEEERRRQKEARRQEEERKRQEEARRQEEERKKQEAEAKRAADGQVWAEQVGTQAAALAATQAGFEQFWNGSSAIQKRLAQMREATQSMSAPQETRQKYVQEYVGTPIFEGAMLAPVDLYDYADAASAVVAAPLFHEASVSATSEADKHLVPVGLEVRAAEVTSNSEASGVHGSTNAPDADHDVISPADDAQSQSEAGNVYGSAAAFSEDQEDFASACASVVAPSDTEDTNFVAIGLNDALVAAPTPHSNVQQTVPCEPEDITPSQVGPRAAANTQPRVAQQVQLSAPPALPKPPFNPFEVLTHIAKAAVVPFDNRPLAPLTQAVNAVVMQLKQYPSCTAPLGMLITKGEEVMRMIQQQPYTPTLDFNERVLRKTLEEKLSCHLRLYQCVAYWSQQLTDTERDAFEAVIIPVFKKRFLCADTAVQQALLTYWENGGSCYTDILQDAAVADWLGQSLCLDIAQEALVNNNTLLRDQFMQSVWRLVQHKQGPAQQKILNQLLWSLRARQQAYQLDLLTLCKLMEWLPTDSDQAIRLLNNEADDWFHTLKVRWIATYLENFKNRYQEAELSELCSLLAHLPWDKAITNSFLSAVDAAQDYTAVKDFLFFLKQYPIEEDTLLHIFHAELPEGIACPCNFLHHALACGLLQEPMKMFDQQSDALYGQLTTLLQSHLGAYDALYTFLTTLQAADMTQQQRSEQALKLQEVLSLLSDYGATTEVCIDTFQSITSQPPSQWEASTHKLVVAATFHASYELSTQEIIDSIAKNAPGIFFAGDAQQLQNSYDALMAAYQGPSAELQQVNFSKPEESKEPEAEKEAALHKTKAQQPIASWSAETITRWAQLVKGQHVQVAQSELLAVIQRAVALHHGFAPRATQLLSVLALLNTPENMGRLAQINTGEGKSLIVAMLAAIHALRGQKVDVLTTSTELSVPEIKKQTPFFKTLGLTVGENSKENTADDDEARHAIYQKDIVYGTAEDFQADIISTEFFRRNIRGHRGFGVVLVDEVDSMLFDDRNYSTRLSSLTPAMNHLEMIYGTLWWFVNLLTSRLRTIDGQYYFIYPEVAFEDAIGGGVKLPEGKALSDCALPIEDPVAFLKERTTGLYSSFVRQLTQEEQKDREAHKAQELRIEELNRDIQELENKLENADPYWLLRYGEKKKTELERLKAEHKAAVEALEHSAWSKVLQERPYLEVPGHLRDFASKQMPNWIESAIYALLCYQKDQHYHVKGGKIVPIDYSNTGVLQYNTVWDNGLAQFLQIKEGLKVRPESIATNFISKPGYFKRYDNRLYGLTGTLGNATTRSFLQEMYGVDMVTIPPYKYREILGNGTSRYLCKELLPKLVSTSAAWYDAVTESALRPARNGQAVLVICNYISQVHHLRERLAAKYDASKLFAYTGEQDFQQHQVDTGEIILATNIAGRGTDLTTSAAVEENGGLHVCITFLPASYRVQLQNAGRTARQGKKGSAQLVLRTSGAETLQDLRTQRDEKEAQGIERAREDVAKMLSSDRLFMRYCGVEASFFPTMEAVAKMGLSQHLLARWQVYAEVALSSEAVEALYEEEVQRYVQTTRQQRPEPDSWQDYTEEALLEARNTQLKHSQTAYREKYPLADFCKEYEAQQREAFLQEQQAHQDIPADVLVAFLDGQVYVPPGSELASQYGWEESERHGSQERWGIWLKEDSTENDMESAARHRRFDGLAKELKDDAQRDKLIQNPYYYVQKGNELLQRGLYSLAVKAYDRSIAIDPLYSVNARFNKARALLSPKENKSDHSKAKNELKEAQRLIAEQKSTLLSFDALMGQTGKKPCTSEHVQHQLDILSQQENYIQAAIGVIKVAQDKDWHVEITEIKSIKEVLEKAEGNRTQAIEEAAVNGFMHVFTIKEKQPKNWWSIVAVALIGLAQIALSVLCTTVGLVNLASNFIQQGISDLMTAFKSAMKGGSFSWKEWGIQKAISLAVAFIGAGVKMLKQWVSDKILPNLNKGIQKFAGKVQAIANRFKVGFSADDASQSRTLLKEVGTRLAGGIVKDLVQTLVNDGLDKLLVEHISASIEKAVTKKIIESLEQNTLVQAAIALDVKNNSNHWQNILQQAGLKILQDPGSEFGRACKEVLKGVITNEVLDQLGENKGDSIGMQFVKGFIQNAPQMAEATHKALTLTGKFLKKFEKEIKDKHKKDIEKAQKEQQQLEETEKQHQESVTAQQQSQEAVQAVSAPPPVAEEDICIPQIAFNKDYKSDLRQYYYEAPSSAGNLYSTFSSHLTSQITNHIQGGIIHPLASIGVNMTVDRMLAGVHKSIEEEKKRYQEGEGGQRDKVNTLSNRLTPEGGITEGGTTEEKAQEAHQQDEQPNESATETQHTPSQPTTANTSAEELAKQCKEGKFGLPQAAILAAMKNCPVAVKENGKLVKIIGDEKPGKIIVIELERLANQESAHWTVSVSKKDQRKAQRMTAEGQKMIAKAQNAIEKHGDSQKAQTKIAAGEKMLAEAKKLSTPMVVNSGVDNCGFDATAFQLDGVSSGAELREQLARYITHANLSLAIELHDTQKQMEASNPGVLMYGGNVGMALLSVQRHDPNSTYNQDRLKASDARYAALREELKSAMSRGNQAQVEALATKCREMEDAAFNARREREREQIRNLGKHAYLFSAGLGNALGNNLSLGAIPRRHLHHPAFLGGQRFGDGMSIGLGAAEFFVGQGIMGSGDLVMVTSGGTLAPVAYSLSTSGAAVSSHGSLVMGRALLEFSKVKEGQYEGKKHNSKNEKHTNLKTKSKAQENYEDAKAALAKYKAESKGNPGRQKKIKQLENRVKHWKKQADVTGETHSRTAKGQKSN